MNISTPVMEAFARLEFMNQEAEHHGEFAEVEVFGVASIPAQTPLFHVLCDDGGIYWRLPLHALCWKQEAPVVPLHDLVMWDSFSYHVRAECFDLLRHKRMEYRRRDGEWAGGIYQFTLDWFGGDGFGGFAETPGQHKCGHVIRLDEGNFACQPNNRVRVRDPNFTTRDEFYPRRIACHLYSSENANLWRTEDSESYHYEIEKGESNGSGG